MPACNRTSVHDAAAQALQEKKEVALNTTAPPPPDDSIPKSQVMSLADAEKILGERAHETERAAEIKDDTSFYRCTYMADIIDTKTGKTGAIYFMIEKYRNELAAQKNYSSIKAANENHGIKVLDKLGDEAYFHSDRKNFYFILVRKGKKMFRIKVNKITSHTSLDEFNSFAGKLTEKL